MAASGQTRSGLTAFAGTPRLKGRAAGAQVRRRGWSRRTSRCPGGRHAAFSGGGRSAPAPRGKVVIDAGSTGDLLQDLGRALIRHSPATWDIARDTAGGAAGRVSQASAILVGLRLASGAPALDRIEAIRAQLPHVGLYVVVRSAAELAPWLPTLSRLGADGAHVLQSASDWAALDDQLQRRLQVPPPEEALRKLWDLWEGNPERPLAMLLVRNGIQRSALGPLLEWLGIRERTCRDRLQRVSQPSPGLLVRLGCVLHACAWGGRGIMEEAANRVGMATAKDLQGVRRRLERALRRWPDVLAILQYVTSMQGGGGVTRRPS